MDDIEGHATADGTIFRVPGKDFFFAGQRRAGRYSKGVQRRVDYLATLYGAWSLRVLLKGEVVVDVGANAGEFSLFAASHGAHVHAIEPDPLACAALRLNARGKRIECHEIALWESDGRRQLRLGTDGASSSLLLKPSAKTVTVEAVTLKTFLNRNDIGDVFLLKADCEGAEPEMLAGAGDALRRIRFITLDCGRERFKQPTDHVCREVLISHGFTVRTVHEERHVLFGERLPA